MASTQAGTATDQRDHAREEKDFSELIYICPSCGIPLNEWGMCRCS